MPEKPWPNIDIALVEKLEEWVGHYSFDSDDTMADVAYHCGKEDLVKSLKAICNKQQKEMESRRDKH